MFDTCGVKYTEFPKSKRKTLTLKLDINKWYLVFICKVNKKTFTI
jgi:hypothetical protein